MTRFETHDEQQWNCENLQYGTTKSQMEQVNGAVDARYPFVRIRNRTKATNDAFAENHLPFRPFTSLHSAQLRIVLLGVVLVLLHRQPRDIMKYVSESR